jgi:carbamoyltransferase
MIITNINKAVEIIINQEVLAIFQNNSEWGPRALGNRSLLFDPRNKNAKEIVNSIKGREWWRPFGATILLEEVHNWFNMKNLKESPFMTYAVKSKKITKKLLPSIVHIDGTCRIQTVTKEQNENFYNLINIFFKKTNVPVLLNTSFNLAKEPLIENIEDAIDTLKRSKLKYIYTPLTIK